MDLTGFTDEAGPDLATQIKATKELGWKALSARMIGDRNIHDLSEAEFDRVAGELEEAGIRVAEFGSLIGNWAKKITDDFEPTLAEIDRAIPRMKRLGTRVIRIMSYAQEPWGGDQFEEERFRRLRIIHRRFADEGLVAAHENCMNYGGFSAAHTLRLLEEVPGLQLVFDTGNPVFQRDRSKPEPHPWQNALEFYAAVRNHIAHVHIKDGRFPVGEDAKPEFTMPGEGDAHLREILHDLATHRYDGGIAIEPHVGKVFHDPHGGGTDWERCYRSYVEYGRRLEAILREMGWEWGQGSMTNDE